MSDNGHLDARTLHGRLNHPVIDADGHWLEYGPVMREEFRRIGGEAAAEGLATASQRVPNALKMSVAERARRRVGQEAFWSSPCENVLDRATAMMPRLMYERLDDLGIDFSVVYPTAGLSYHRMQDTRMRRAICRAYNVFAADQFRGLEDRVIPAAIIPMYTPEEAIEEIEFAATQLGYKVIMVGGHDAAAGARAGRGAAGRGEPGRVVRRRRPRQPPRLRPGVAQVPGAQAGARPSTTAPARSCCATRRRTSATTTSATSPPPATRWPRRCSSGASPAGSPTSTSRSSRAAWAGPACSTRI